MSKHYRYAGKKSMYPYLYALLTLVILSAGVLIYALRKAAGAGLFSEPDRKLDQYSFIDRLPKIHPNFHGTIIPPNIAPLNFLVEESGSQYCVKIYSNNGKPIQIFSRSPKITIPQRAWDELLNANRGEQLSFDVFVKMANPPDTMAEWNRFSAITNKIADEDIDGFLVYRRVHPGHGFWSKMGIYQRNLHRFDESLILDNGYFKGGCLNCHAFCNNRANKMSIDIRSAKYGTSALLVEDGAAEKVDIKLGFLSWHPSGRLIACSIFKPRLLIHTARNYVQDILELDSLLAYFLVDSKTLKTSPQISKKDRLETYPNWSPDGGYLYFSSAPKWWSDNTTVLERHNEIKYDLVRISYDIDHDKWGKLQTVLSAKDTGRSILLPRISPDGRWLLFCMCDYGAWAVHHPSSDLYMLDLETPQQTGKYEYRRLGINSDKSESWHSWSSNSRWIAFSSKRKSGVFTRTYISYVDRQGKVYNPLLLPQKDPTYYDSCLWTYSVPELVREPVRVTKEKLGRVVRGSRKISAPFPVTMATPKAGAPPESAQPWLTERE